MYSSPTAPSSSGAAQTNVTVLRRDTSAKDPAIVSSVDVTEDILRQHLIYGSSDSTAPHNLAASRSLNFATGASIQRPEKQVVTIIPQTLKYQGSTGLFGAENHFVRVDCKVNLSVTLKCFEEPFWECARISNEPFDPSSVYEAAVIDYYKDFGIVNDYEPANITSRVRATTNSYISVDLSNLKTGNKYIDSWLDVRLYTSEREEHPYDKMYVRLNDFFYIGFHARNTRRLEYNVEALVGDELLPATAIEDRRFIARRINQ